MVIIMKNDLKDFLFNLAVSMLIGVLVCIVKITILNMSRETVEDLIMFSILGGVIGTISRAVFMYMFEIKPKNAITAFVGVFIVIGSISCLPSFYEYFIYNTIISVSELISILITAELLGMSFTYYSYKRCLAFNSKLISKKNELLRKTK